MKSKFTKSDRAKMSKCLYDLVLLSDAICYIDAKNCFSNQDKLVLQLANVLNSIVVCSTIDLSYEALDYIIKGNLKMVNKTKVDDSLVDDSIPNFSVISSSLVVLDFVEISDDSGTYYSPSITYIFHDGSEIEKYITLMADGIFPSVEFGIFHLVPFLSTLYDNIANVSTLFSADGDEIKEYKIEKVMNKMLKKDGIKKKSGASFN